MFGILSQAKRAVLCWSGGLDSTLVLAMLREQEVDFDILILGRERWTKEQKKRTDDLIKEWDLKCFTYPAISQNLIGNGHLAAVFEYAVNGGVIPLVQDLIPGKRCLFDVLEGHRCTTVPFEWDLFITGGRKDDTHWSMRPVPNKEWTVGNTRFYAPLFDKNREWVKSELIKRGLGAEDVPDEADSGNLVACSKCLEGTDRVFCPKQQTEIDSIQWDRTANLRAFQDSLGAKPIGESSDALEHLKI